MIEQDIVDYLKADTTLSNLIGASGSDSKIYPIQIPQGATEPYIIYNLVNDGGIEENIRESSLSFDCIDSNYGVAENIRNRLAWLLDRQDDIRKRINSDEYRYFWSKKIGGVEYKEPVIDIFHRVSIYDFKYVPFDFLLQETKYYLLLEDGFKIRLE